VDVAESEAYELIDDSSGQQTFYVQAFVTTTADNQVIQLYAITGNAGGGLNTQILDYSLSSLTYAKLSS